MYLPQELKDLICCNAQSTRKCERDHFDYDISGHRGKKCVITTHTATGQNN